MKTLLALLSMSLLMVSCEVSPQAINFGHDACHYCKMTIVDTQHASELVTVKGKVFKYDAIECMMNHLTQWDQKEVKCYLVTDYSEPKKFIDATKAHYLISKTIPSPMGEFLSAFYQQEQRDEQITEFQGVALDWPGLKERFESKGLTTSDMN